MEYAFKLGNHPTVSISELVAIFPKIKLISLLEDNVLLAKLPQKIEDPRALIDSLGGTIMIHELPHFVAKATSTAVEKYAEKYVEFDHKVNFAVTSINFPHKKQADVRNLDMKTKKEFRRDEKSVRVIQGDITAAHIIKEKLLPEKGGIHVVLISYKNTTYIGHTVATQNIDDYSLRDYDKPVRDAKNGMMPPKLVQIMINFAQPEEESVVYDPFVGTGTTLIEAARLGYDLQGSDKYEKYIEATQRNLAWYLEQRPQYAKENQTIELFTADASQLDNDKVQDVGAIVTEGFLGVPHGRKPEKAEAQRIVKDLEKMYLQFFDTAKEVKEGVRVVLTTPSIQSTSGPVGMTDGWKAEIERKGFEQIRIEEGWNCPEYKKEKLIYSRPDQVVQREILIFEKA